MYRATWPAITCMYIREAFCACAPPRVLHFNAFIFPMVRLELQYIVIVIATWDFPCVIGDIPCYNREYSMYTFTATIERLLCYPLLISYPTTPYLRYPILHPLPHYYIVPTLLYYLPHPLPTLLSYSDS